MRVAVVLLSLFLSLFLSCGSAQAGTRGPEKGDLAPALLGQDPDGKPVTLDAFRGKLVVVAFWNSSCAYCLVEVPTLENLQRQLGGDHLQVVALDLGDDRKAWAAMLRQMDGYALLQAHDPAGTVAANWGVQMLPNLWLLDAEGKVLRHYEDYGEEALPKILEDIHRELLRTRVVKSPAIP